ncbi:MAG: energy-coupling factor ABC transporter ATP-binding protein [Chloroflexota bacterium]
MTDALIHVNQVTFSYSPSASALREVSVQIASGEMTALIGNNGSGKSTLMKLIVGLVRPTSGSVVIDGQDTRRVKVSTLAQHVGFIFQNPNDQLFAQSVEDEIRFGLKNLGLPANVVEQRIEETISRFGLNHIRGDFPRFLSRGDKQKVCLASVVAMHPRVLLLDEPTTGQDHRDARAILDLATELNAAGITVLLVTHDLINVAAYARRAIVLRDGVIAKDAPTHEVLTDLPLLQSCNLVTPQVVQLSLALQDLDVPLTLRTDDFVSAVGHRLNNARSIL